MREYLHDHLKVLLGGRGDRVWDIRVIRRIVGSGNGVRGGQEDGMGTHIIYPHFSEIHHLINNAYQQAALGGIGPESDHQEDALSQGFLAGQRCPRYGIGCCSRARLRVESLACHPLNNHRFQDTGTGVVR